MTIIGESFVRVGALTGDFEKDLDTRLTRAVEVATGRVQSTLDQRLSATGTVLTRQVTPAATIAAAAFGRVFQVFDRGEDTLRAVTGATGELFDELLDSGKSVAGEVSTAFDQVLAVLAQVRVRTGLAGQPLEDLTKTIVEFTELIGGDAATNADVFLRLLQGFRVSAADSIPTLDLLLRAQQATGVGAATIAENALQARLSLEQLDLTVEESIALAAQLGPAFATAAPAIRIAIANLSQSGVQDIPGAFRAAVEEIQNAATAADANRRAIELFGTRAGPQLASLIREGRLEIAEFTDTLERGRETIRSARDETRDFGDSVRGATNAVIGAVGPYSEFIASFATIAAGTGPVIVGVGAVGRAFRNSGVDKALLAQQVAAGRAGQSMTRFGAILPAITSNVGKLAKGLGILTIVAVAIEEIGDALPEVSESLSLFKDNIDDAFDFDELTVRERFGALGNAVKEVFTPEGGMGFDEIFDGFNEGLKAATGEATEGTEATRTLSEEVGGLTAEAIDAAAATGELSDEQDRGVQADRQRTISSREVARAYRDATDAAEAQRIAELGLAQGLLGIQGAAVSARDAEQRLADARLAVERLERRRQVGTVAHREALDELALAQLDAVGGQLGIAQAVAQFVSEAGGGGQRRANQLVRDYGRQAGLSAEEIRDLEGTVQDLIGDYRELPGSKLTTAELADDIALRKIDRLKRRLDSIPERVETEVAVTTSVGAGPTTPAGVGGAAAFAGQFPARGPVPTPSPGPAPPGVTVNVNLDGRRISSEEDRRETLLGGGF